MSGGDLVNDGEEFVHQRLRRRRRNDRARMSPVPFRLDRPDLIIRPILGRDPGRPALAIEIPSRSAYRHRTDPAFIVACLLSSHRKPRPDRF